jgi:hypothetical protein
VVARTVCAMQSRRWQGQAPRDSLLHPVWEPVINGTPPDEPFVARCLLGAGWVGANCRLSMLDLRVWAALCALLRAQLPDIEGDGSELRDMAVRTVKTTGYQLADRVFGQDGGNRYRRLLRSLARLRVAEVTVQIVEADPELAAERVVTGYVPLTGEMWLATTRLDLRTPREWGALKGTSTLKVEIGHWVAQQVLAGRCTWLDLDLLRALGPGMPARLWVALEAWARWPARSFDGREATAIGLGEPALQSLGVGGYDRLRDARRALDRAGERLVAVDPAYELVRCERRAGSTLIVRRLGSAKARATVRQGASWRSTGIPGKRQRADRAAVRAAVRASLSSPNT